MLKLTNAHPNKNVKGELLYIAVNHIVSIRPVGDGSGILTVAGIDYTVAEQPDSVATLCKSHE